MESYIKHVPVLVDTDNTHGPIYAIMSRNIYVCMFLYELYAHRCTRNCIHVKGIVYVCSFICR